MFFVVLRDLFIIMVVCFILCKLKKLVIKTNI
jgi:hypothetical protein